MYKEIRYRFHGRDLFFALSMGLFSSNTIDSGSELLLKHLPELIKPDSVQRVLDTGCGTGVIGIALKSAFPHLEVDALDRDALAVAATRLNAEKNKLEISAYPGLDAQVLTPPFLGSDHQLTSIENAYDLIVSNIPAKAGYDGHVRFFRNGLANLAENGTLAIVIVDTLGERAEQIAAQLQAPITFKVDGPRHSVYFFSKPQLPVSHELSFPGSYKRQSCTFDTYTLDTVYDIPGFDTPSFDEQLMGKHVDISGCTGITCWNPRQGHAVLSLLAAHTIKQVHLAGRDLLALLISAHNIRRSRPECTIEIEHCISIDSISHTEDALIILPDPIPNIPWTSQLDKLEGTSPILAVSAKSSTLSPLDKGLSGYKKRVSKKSRGFRVIVFNSLYI
jgi:16S rRNA (guanine1207-N2)-methyltransferase